MPYPYCLTWPNDNLTRKALLAPISTKLRPRGAMKKEGPCVRTEDLVEAEHPRVQF